MKNIVNRALKVKLNPDENQIDFLNQSCGISRFFYNYLLNEKIQFYKSEIEPISDKNQRKEKWKEFNPTTKKKFKEKFEFAKICSDDCLNSTERNLQSAFSNFIKSLKGLRKGKKVGFPKFKSKKKHKDSYKECHLKRNAFDFHNRRINISKCTPIKFCHSEKLPRWYDKEKCKLKSITISKDSCVDYYASLLFELENFDKSSKPVSEKQAKGFDFSPEEMYVDSDGHSAKDYGYRAFKQEHLPKLRHLQRLMEKKSPNSKNREKARIKVAKLERHIANHRKDFQEKHSRELVQEYSLIGVETLNLQGISKFLRNAKNMNDSAWYRFTEKLVYKGREEGCQVIKSDKWFPSSQTCNVCGYQKKDLTLKDRKWVCPECHTNHNRDHNAAINLKNNALNKVGIVNIKVPLKQGELMSVENQYKSTLRLSDKSDFNSVDEKKFCEAEMIVRENCRKAHCL